MSGFLLAMVGSFVLSLWGRDVRDLGLYRRAMSDADANEVRLAIALGVAALTATVSALVGSMMGMSLSDHARIMFVALALGIAASELLWPEKLGLMREPTQSLGAFTLVTLFRQQTGAARLLVLAFAAAYPYPALAALGGAIGGMAAVALGWFAHDQLLNRLPRRAIRVGLGIILLLVAVYTGLIARGIV